MVVVFACFLWVPSRALSADIQSCEDIKRYLGRPLPGNYYARIQDLKAAEEVLKSQTNLPSSECPIWLIERTYWEYGYALKEFSRNFQDPSARQRWLATTAEAYKDYLSWFESLTEDQIDRLVMSVTQAKKVQNPEFPAIRRTWLRERVGNVIGALGITYEDRRQFLGLITEYQEIGDRNYDKYALLFPNQAVQNWFKYLRAMPEFAADKNDSQIRMSLEQRDVAGAWESFRDFLKGYIKANPSVRGQWTPVVTKISQWLRT